MSSRPEGAPPSVTLQLRAGVASITLNRPDKLNALDAATLEQLVEAFAAADADSTIGAILLCGAGRAFCAGADRDAVASLSDEDAIRRHAERMASAMRAVAEARLPTIAAVHGYALGAGCGLVAACDIAVAAKDAILGFPEMTKGILPAIVTPCLVKAIGQRQAFALLATSRRLSAAEAAAVGLVTQIADGNVADEAQAIASRLASARAGLPVWVKMLVAQCAGQSLANGLELARQANASERLAQLRQRH